MRLKPFHTAAPEVSTGAVCSLSRACGGGGAAARGVNEELYCRQDHAASIRLKPFHTAVAAPEVSTGKIRVS
jgi:hypothetical protein